MSLLPGQHRVQWEWSLLYTTFGNVIESLIFVGDLSAQTASSTYRFGTQLVSPGISMIVKKYQELCFVLLILFLYTIILFRTAWLCDDAFITFRTVDNFIHGYGLRWNVHERVQAFTHPLWLLLLSFFYYLTNEIYYTCLFLSLAISLAVGYIFVVRAAFSWIAALVALLILTFSKSFMEYSTSGLENPLSHLFLAWFFTVLIQDNRKSGTVFGLATVAALATLNRPDTILLYLPPLSVLIWNSRSWKIAALAGLAFWPVAVWELFSIVYYGYPFPNTVYAKLLNTGIPQQEFFMQGLSYFWNSLRWDPVTLITISCSLILAATTRQWIPVSLGTGIVLYMLYLLRIGGDFMSGRFLSLPLLASVLLLARYPFYAEKPSWVWVSAMVVLIGLCSPEPTVMSGAIYGTELHNMVDAYDIYNERAHYYQKTGLLAMSRGSFSPDAKVRYQQLQDPSLPPVRVDERIGIKGFLSGPDIHIIDYAALADPFLSRLPALKLPREKPWIVGHFYRFIPQGYRESVIHHENRIHDENLARLYDRITTITQGDLWSRQRWQAIWEMNTTRINSRIDVEFYRAPEIAVQIDTIPPSDRTGAIWYDKENLLFSCYGMQIEWSEVRHGSRLELSLDDYNRYCVEFYIGDTLIAAENLPSIPRFSDILITHRLDVPSEAVSSGYTALRIQPESFHYRHSLGHLRLCDSFESNYHDESEQSDH